MARFQKMYGNASLQCVGHISAYTGCITRFRDEEDVTKSILLHGTADDLTPTAPCREYAEQLSKAGKTARITGRGARCLNPDSRDSCSCARGRGHLSDKHPVVFAIRCRSDIQGRHEDIARIGIGVSNPRSKCSPSGRQGPGAAAAKEAVATTGQPSFFVKS
jgi:hypothetical protein